LSPNVERFQIKLPVKLNNTIFASQNKL
jgi:hypothetical protein